MFNGYQKCVYSTDETLTNERDAVSSLVNGETVKRGIRLEGKEEQIFILIIWEINGEEAEEADDSAAAGDMG